MSVLSSKALQERLSAIMEALTRAAVAEICELVDGGYALLQMEISRKQRENEDLRKKLHLIESIVVRGGGGGGKADEPQELSPESDGEGERPEQRQRTEDARDAAADAGGAGEAEVTVLLREELPDVVLIKDEDSDSDDTGEEDNTSTPVRCSTKRCWTGSEADGRKSSPGQPAPKASRVAAGRQRRGVSIFTLESPRSEPGHSSQLGEDETETDTSACSYSARVEQDGQLLSPAAGRQSAYFGMQPPSPSNRAEPDLKLLWSNLPKDHMTVSHFHQNKNLDGDAFGIKLISVSGSASTDSQLSESSSSAFEYETAEVANYAPYREQQSLHGQPVAGGRGKRFVCSVCNKTYATAQNLDVHMRIHTGERPFGCEQCGKKFLQSAHLKSHQSVHTGERPYVCSICSRSFIVKYSLKLHMRKCHASGLSQ